MRSETAAVRCFALIFLPSLDLDYMYPTAKTLSGGAVCGGLLTESGGAVHCSACSATHLVSAALLESAPSVGQENDRDNDGESQKLAGLVLSCPGRSGMINT